MKILLTMAICKNILGLFEALGSRPMAGHAALDRRIGVRIPAPQPNSKK